MNGWNNSSYNANCTVFTSCEPRANFMQPWYVVYGMCMDREGIFDKKLQDNVSAP